MRRLLIIGAAIALVAVTAVADTTRSPDSTATSAVGTVNTTVGHWAVSRDGSLDTNPVGMIITFR